MADLALSQVANRCTEHLTQSEYRRLMIGIQLIKDPGTRLTRTTPNYSKHIDSSRAVVGRTDVGPRSAQHVPRHLDPLQRVQEVRHGHHPDDGETALRRLSLLGEGAVLVPRRRGVHGRNAPHARLLLGHRIPLSSVGKSLDVLP